ncbi:DUF6223 family protein [Streptomyces sp. NPDC006798]|uniref:DUF6223 family protein n=1 Tax=Streptomyces sp. NPDC006798 TaxID=3155462 RepID=UPI00340472CC
MNRRHPFAVVPAALLVVLVSAAPAAAHAPAPPIAADITDFGLGRAGASIGALLGLAAIAVACLALARPTARLGTTTGRLGAGLAVAAGLGGMALGAVVAATADGGLGTGNGLGGAYAAILTGGIGTAVGVRAMRRARRTG